MANRNRNAYDADRLPRPASERFPDTRDPVSTMPFSDEMIISLANTYENKRARQVSEWQRAQAVNVRRII